MTKRICCRPLSANIGRAHLEEIFGAYGPIDDIFIPRANPDRAMIEFRNQEDALKALDHMDGSDLDGEKLSLSWAPRRPDNRYKTHHTSEYGGEVRRNRSRSPGAFRSHDRPREFDAGRRDHPKNDFRAERGFEDRPRHADFRGDERSRNNDFRHDNRPRHFDRPYERPRIEDRPKQNNDWDNRSRNQDFGSRPNFGGEGRGYGRDQHRHDNDFGGRDRSNNFHRDRDVPRRSRSRSNDYNMSSRPTDRLARRL
jgi:RNA recognition motif-containing protein